MNRVHFMSTTDNWSTPKDVYRTLDAEFGFDYDPCPLAEQPLFDGLETEWGEVNFVNPPYSKIKDWCKRLMMNGRKVKQL